MRTLAVEAPQEKRRISRYKATAADPELKVSNGEGGWGGGGLEVCESQSSLAYK